MPTSDTPVVVAVAFALIVNAPESDWLPGTVGVLERVTVRGPRAVTTVPSGIPVPVMHWPTIGKVPVTPVTMFDEVERVPVNVAGVFATVSADAGMPAPLMLWPITRPDVVESDVRQELPAVVFAVNAVTLSTVRYVADGMFAPVTPCP